LIEELNSLYDVPRKIAQEWVAANTILPLLDGLDEVAPEHRAACAEMINAGRQNQYGLTPIAVCSRVADYAALAAKLRLQAAVVVQQLTPRQVDAYLTHAGTQLCGVQAALHADAELRELLDTPLMLSIVALAYAEKSTAEMQAAGTPDERRQHLFDAYIEAMFKRRSKEARYPQQQTLRWLRSLAHEMTRQAQTVFLVEGLQPAWLPTRAVRLRYALLDRCIGVLVGGLTGASLGGLVVGLLIGLGVGSSSGLPDASLGGLVVGLLVGLLALFFGGQTNRETLQQRPLQRTIVDALFGGLLGGLLGGLGSGLVAGSSGGLVGVPVGVLLGGLLGFWTGKPGVSPRQVIVVERLRWVWSNMWRSAASGLLGGLGVGLVFGLVFGLLGGLSNDQPVGLVVDLVVELVFGLSFALVFGLVFGMVFGLLGGLSSGPLAATIRVNQGIRHSARSALVGGLGGGLLSGLLIGLVTGLLIGLSNGLLSGLLIGLVLGLVGALAFGGYACLSHLALRLVLHRNGILPLRLIPFLDYCAERIFLRKVGGGYIFAHRLLMEHFASLTDKAGEE
jgi:hypothetical protein